MFVVFLTIPIVDKLVRDAERLQKDRLCGTLLFMKRLVTTALLFGYVLLVPFCFFGGALSVHAIGMDMGGGALHQMNDCAMQLGGCGEGAATGAMDPVAHHLGMYNSITQTPLAAPLILMTLVVAFSLSLVWFTQQLRSTRSADTVFRLALQRERKRPRATRQHILVWLSLFETSPNRA